MSNTKKTIQINPELFKLPGSAKTRKNREKKELAITPMISPNNLKNKLLKRIKEHKMNETNTNKRVKNTSNSSNTSMNSNKGNNSETKYTDEFYSAMNYLSDLSKKQKKTNEKNYATASANLNNRTLKKYSSISAPAPTTTITNISLELPPELQEQKPSYFVPDSNPSLSLNTPNDMPYGCLKNGSKPTYRDWIKTRKNHEFPELNARPPTPPKRNTFLEGGTPMSQITSVLTPTITKTPTSLSREQRLEQIKQKLKQIQDQEIKTNPEASKLNENIKMLEAVIPESEKLPEILTMPNIDDIKMDSPLDVSNVIKEIKEKEENVPRQYLKRTIRRKFTLGKSDKLRKVAVLLKDKQTRKNVIDVQHELKKTSMTDVRKYLRQHGIIKIGSTAPNEMLRKTFETAMLAGEITNINKDTLLHNFMNEDVKENS
jgi:hypothetical protein